MTDGKTRWVQLRIPISEGARFTVGSVTVEGQTLFKEEVLAPLFGLKTGDVYRQNRVRKGFDIAPRPPVEGAVADVTIRVQEGKPYSVRRIEFAGNTLSVIFDGHPAESLPERAEKFRNLGMPLELPV